MRSPAVSSMSISRAAGGSTPVGQRTVVGGLAHGRDHAPPPGGRPRGGRRPAVLGDAADLVGIGHRGGRRTSSRGRCCASAGQPRVVAMPSKCDRPGVRRPPADAMVSRMAARSAIVRAGSRSQNRDGLAVPGRRRERVARRPAPGRSRRGSRPATSRDVGRQHRQVGLHHQLDVGRARICSAPDAGHLARVTPSRRGRRRCRGWPARTRTAGLGPAGQVEGVVGRVPLLAAVDPSRYAACWVWAARATAGSR